MSPQHPAPLTRCQCATSAARSGSPPACRTLSFGAESSLRTNLLSDGELCRLLHLPVTQHCQELHLTASRSDIVESDEKQPNADDRLTPSKRKSSSDNEVVRQRLFVWAHIRLPAVTRLSFQIGGRLPYTGVACVPHCALCTDRARRVHATRVCGGAGCTLPGSGCSSIADSLPSERRCRASKQTSTSHRSLQLSARQWWQRAAKRGRWNG